MTLLSNHKHRVAAAATAVVVAVGGGSAALVAGAGSSAATSTASLAAATAPAQKVTPAQRDRIDRRRDLWARADFATVEVKVKGRWVTYTLDRGKVTAVSPTAISLLRPDGQSATLTIDSATRFRGVASSSEVKDGVRASVISEDGTALRVTQPLHPRAAAGTTDTTAA